MTSPVPRLFAALAAIALAASVPAAHAALAQQPSAPAAKPTAAAAAAAPAARDGKKDRASPGPLGNLGGNSKEPIKIDADRLDVFDKEQRAVFQGNVVVVQGETTMRCSTLTVFYENQKGGAGGQRAPAAAAGSQNDNIKQIDCAGPVTVVSKDQVATGDHAVFDRAANKVTMTGNAVLSQCQNVTRGERIVYDLNTGVANVETAPGKRVSALIIPGSNDEEKQKQGCQQPQQAGPAPAAPAATAQPAAAARPAPQPQAAAPKPSPKQRAQTN
jgi:lipopolysaccharide export system protein LptA